MFVHSTSRSPSKRSMTMGIFKLFSGCNDAAHDRYENRVEYVYVDRAPGNPNPARFTIIRMQQVSRFLIAEVHYPDCQNYEGRKILVYEGITENVLQRQTSLDPHFCNSSKHPSPVARFEPSARGFKYAVSFCRNT